MKRKGRSQTLLDIDDLTILSYFRYLDSEIPLISFRNILNISHNGLLTHINRLKKFGFIEIHREKDSYKTKFVKVTNKGLKISKIFLKNLGNKKSYENMTKEEITKLPLNIQGRIIYYKICNGGKNGKGV